MTIKLQSRITARKPRELLPYCHVGNSISTVYFNTLFECCSNSSAAAKAMEIEFTSEVGGNGEKKTPKTLAQHKATF